MKKVKFYNESSHQTKHTIKVGEIHNGVKRIVEIIADSFDDAMEYTKKINKGQDFVVFDNEQRIVHSKREEQVKEYKHKNEKHDHEHDHHDDHEHGHHDDDSYA